MSEALSENISTVGMLQLAERYPIHTNHNYPLSEYGLTALAILEKAAAEGCHQTGELKDQCWNHQWSGADRQRACSSCLARMFFKEEAEKAVQQDQVVASRQSIGYPMDWRTRLLGPAMHYIDKNGTPIELRLTNDQVQMIVDDWNSGPDDSEPGDMPTVLKPPCAESTL